MYQVTSTITIRIEPDQTDVYPENRLDAGKAVDTFKKRMIEVFGETIFENTCVREIKSKD
jgi:hypothetical protein